MDSRDLGIQARGSARPASQRPGWAAVSVFAPSDAGWGAAACIATSACGIRRANRSAMTPHPFWSGVGVRDREPGLRICPTFCTSADAAARQFSFEHRAGFAGIRAGLAAPAPRSRKTPNRRRQRPAPPETSCACRCPPMRPWRLCRPIRLCSAFCRTDCCRPMSPKTDGIFPEPRVDPGPDLPAPCRVKRS